MLQVVLTKQTSFKMGSTYYLGWPGLESAPVHVIDIKNHQIFNKQKPVPNFLALKLNKVENRYVELSWIVNRFGVSQQQGALNVLMKLVGDLAMPKFYVGPDNVAYVPLNTLFTFVVCYPQNTNFRICRNSLLNHLGNFLELACSICGFIRRDCICESRLYDMGRENFIGMVKEIRSTGVQCSSESQPASRSVSPNPVYTSSDNLQKIVDEVARGAMDEAPKETSKSVPSTPNIPPASAPPFPWGPQHMKSLFSPALYRPPLPPPKPKTREIGIQTRAVYDFSNRKKRLSKKEREDEAIIEAQIAASERAKSIPEEKENENAEELDKEKEMKEDGEEIKKPEEESQASQGEISTPEKSAPSTPLANLNTATPDPVRISLWKLIDSEDDSSDEEVEKETDKQAESENKENKIEDKERKDTEDGKDLKQSEDSTDNNAQKKDVEGDEDKTKDSEKDKSMDSVINDKDEPRIAEQTVENEVETAPEECTKPVSMDIQNDTGDVELSFDAGTTHKQPEVANVDDDNDDEAEPMDTSTTETDTAEETVPNIPVENGVAVNESGEIKKPESEMTETMPKKPESETAEPVVEKPMSDAPMEPEGETAENVVKKPESVPINSEKSFQDAFLNSIQSDSQDKPEESSNTRTDFQAQLEQFIKEGKSNSGSEKKDTNEMLPLDKEKQESLLCEITGKVIEEGAKPPVEAIVIPPSPPPTDPLSTIPPVTEHPKQKPKLLAKKWAQKFEYTPTQEKIYRCTFSRCGQCFDTKRAAALHDKAHGAFGRESATHLMCWECDKYTTTFAKW